MGASAGVATRAIRAPRNPRFPRSSRTRTSTTREARRIQTCSPIRGTGPCVFGTTVPIALWILLPRPIARDRCKMIANDSVEYAGKTRAGRQPALRFRRRASVRPPSFSGLKSWWAIAFRHIRSIFRASFLRGVRPGLTIAASAQMSMPMRSKSFAIASSFALLRSRARFPVMPAATMARSSSSSISAARTLTPSLCRFRQKPWNCAAIATTRAWLTCVVVYRRPRFVPPTAACAASRWDRRCSCREFHVSSARDIAG